MFDNIICELFLFASIVPYNFTVIPKVNCNDINNNGYPDFIAYDNEEFPREIYHLEIINDTIHIIWSFSLKSNKNSYFEDIIFDDFNNDTIFEMIVSAYDDEGEDIIYIFSFNNEKLFFNPPIITNVKNYNIKEPRKFYILPKDRLGKKMFIIVQGSPNRKVIICEYDNIKIT